MPPLVLHVLPPAFALPSVSSDCIEAVALLRYTSQYATWIVVPDAAEFPHRLFPFLTPAYHHSEPSPDPVEGLDAIIEYLSTCGQTGHLEGSLNSSQKSQVIALSSHLHSRLKPLIALSLYLCSENYTSLTRPSFAKVLPFPESWILPHRLYDQALENCTHLGITAKDLSLLAEDATKNKGQTLGDGGPVTGDDAYGGLKPAQKSNPTIATRLKLQQKIDDLVHAALAPFVSALALSGKQSLSENSTGDTDNESFEGAKARWLFGSPTVTAADLTALSSLSLAVLPYLSVSSTATNTEPSLAIPFLPASIHKQFPKLVSRYLLPALEDAFGGKTSLEQAMLAAPLAAIAAEEDEEDEGAHDDAIQGYGNMDVGSGQLEIPWRRKGQDSGWASVQRFGNALGAVLTESMGI